MCTLPFCRKATTRFDSANSVRKVVQLYGVRRSTRSSIYLTSLCAAVWQWPEGSYVTCVCQGSPRPVTECIKRRTWSGSAPVEHLHRRELPVGKQLPTIGLTEKMATKSAESLTDNPEEVQRNRNAGMGTVSLALPDSDLVNQVDPWALTELVDNSPKWSGETLF